MSGFVDLGSEPGDGLAGRYTAASDRVTEFYVPLLQRAVRYDRAAGYFNSGGLAAAAQGLAHFVTTGGTMRLIVGAELTEADLDAITGGVAVDGVLADRLAGVLPASPEELADDIWGHRLEVLAWLCAQGRLEIRVALRRGSDGQFVAADESTTLFHDKYGVFTDGDGRKVAFSGSGNETKAGWLDNSESFDVYASWWADGMYWRSHGGGIEADFERLWAGEQIGSWATVPMATALREQLIGLAPAEPPVPKQPKPAPAEPVPPAPVGESEARAALDELLARMRATPGSGVATAGVVPLPHQAALMHRVLARWPRGHLFGDEVGLGKTIEVGLTIREALVRGHASRVLLLVPAAVLGQWQEELAEKLALWVPRWDGGMWHWPDKTTTPARDGNPWGASWPVTLASSHLARLERSRRLILASGRWDIVAVDEAHHARRRGGKPDGDPNMLLRLLQEMRRENLWDTLLMASATPMQMHPHELWDLVELFGMPDGWAEEPKFERYFDEVRRDEFAGRQWVFLGDMAHAHRQDVDGETDPTLDAEIRAKVTANRLAVTSFGKRDVKQAFGATVTDPTTRSYVDAWLLTNNPIRDRMIRNTRTTLRAYADAGILNETIPVRSVDDVFLTMDDDERAVYRRVRDYIRGNYNAALAAGGAKRRALGFIMTVYRRRLTSSFAAIEASLRRRLDRLEGRLDTAALLDDDDRNLFDELPDTDLGDAAVSLIGDEIAELRSFIDDIDKLTSDTKQDRLVKLLSESFNAGHRTVLVFTQYADTAHHLANQLDSRWVGQVLVYTGDGGRLRNPATGQWQPVKKKEAKDLFRAGDQVKILIGTESLAEGLNLQTCGRLINYDMPWNFTRVEQRIGRVDRIGGQPTVEVTNLFYERTVEASIYRTLVDTFGGFDFIIGDAQPVLGDIEAAIEKAAFTDDEDEDGTDPTELFPISQGLVGEIRERLTQARAEFDLGALNETRADTRAANGFPDVVTLEQLRDAVLAVPSIAKQLTENDPGVYRLDSGDQVTFDRDILADRAPDVRLLAPGDPLFDRVVGTHGGS